MKSEFALAFNEITERFGLTKDTVMQALEAAMVSAYRRAVNASTAQRVEAKVNPETGEVEIFAEKEVVESVENPQTEVPLEEALRVDPEAALTGVVLVESTPKDFGRVAAQTAKQVILQRLREAERDAQYEEFIEREGDMVHGTVHSITPQAVTVGLGRAEAILPRNQQIPGEPFRIRDRIRVYVLEVRKSSRGPVIVVSRTHPNMLRRLLEMEVPEISQGLVEIKAIAREAGKRAKVAVAALREGVDPVGACVGLRGVRIQSIVRDLNDEKIDVIEWNPESASFIAKALSPARVSGVYLDDDPDRGNTAMVVVPEDQLSLAIGRAGVNARLAARLTGWRIDIKSLPEAASESFARLQSDAALAELAKGEVDTLPTVEGILAKKEENRPVTPEEYQILTSFVDRVQKQMLARRASARRERMEKLELARAQIAPTAYDTPLADIGLSTRVLNLLTEAGFQTAGPLWEKMLVEQDAILGLEGVGPKTVEEVLERLQGHTYPEPVVEEVPVEEVPAPEPEVAPVGELQPVEGAPIEGAPVAAEAGAEAAVAEAGAPLRSVEEVFGEIAGKLAVGQSVPEVAGTEETTEEASEEAGKKGKKRKKPAKIIEFDPESGEMIVRRHHKAGEEFEDPEF
jgi:N utilization substance protein A